MNQYMLGICLGLVFGIALTSFVILMKHKSYVPATILECPTVELRGRCTADTMLDAINGEVQCLS
jgi:hypothetical protein